MPSSLFELPGGWELFLIIAVVVLLFGAKKLPELARNSGQALRIFKAETQALREGDGVDASPVEGVVVGDAPGQAG